MDGDYDYHAEKKTPTTRELEHQMAHASLQAGSPVIQDDGDDDDIIQAKRSTDEALMDLAQLEELQEEAERMKALGNKHMAAQVSYSTTKK